VPGVRGQQCRRSGVGAEKGGRSGRRAAGGMTTARDLLWLGVPTVTPPAIPPLVDEPPRAQ